MLWALSHGQRADAQSSKLKAQSSKPRIMEIIKTSIKDLLVIKPDVFRDERGYFYESYNKERFAKEGLTMTFVQDNESKSSKGVLRGLHFQKPPYAQGKLVRVVKGAVMDIAVDLRKDSPTYVTIIDRRKQRNVLDTRRFRSRIRHIGRRHYLQLQMY